MSAPQITALPTPPQRASAPEQFVTDADAFLAALPTFRAEANVLANYLENLAILADGGTYQVITGAYDEGADKVLSNASHGFLGYFGTGDLDIIADADTISRASRYAWDSSTTGIAAFMGSSGVVETIRRISGAGIARRYQIGISGGLSFRFESSLGFREQDWIKMWGENNTTVDGSGFILEASPVLRLYTDRIEEPNKPVGATLTRRGPGHYVLTGCPPLATEGWRTRDAVDAQGAGRGTTF